MILKEFCVCPFPNRPACVSHFRGVRAHRPAGPHSVGGDHEGIRPASHSLVVGTVHVMCGFPVTQHMSLLPGPNFLPLVMPSP